METQSTGTLSPWAGCLSTQLEARLTPKVCIQEYCRDGLLLILPIDTSHVPCKFFRLGQCQAGKACPFSHSTDMLSMDTPCKYFAKVRSILLLIIHDTSNNAT